MGHIANIEALREPFKQAGRTKMSVVKMVAKEMMGKLPTGRAGCYAVKAEIARRIERN